MNKNKAMFHLNLNTALLMSEANCRPVEEGNDPTLIDVTTTLIEVQALFTMSTAMKPLQQRIQMKLISVIHHKITATWSIS